MGAPGTTPGPWMAAASPSSVVGWPVVACGDSPQAGRSIASLSYLPGHAESEVEAKANGHQIAASPRLYDALENLLKATQPQAMTDHRVILGEAQAEAAASLAEARGEKLEQDQ